ncbi:ATP-dependent zinc protease family protein [Litoribacillus peritrichatus]|uniref:RimK/LysX family protein n=1 Tax=Litoribacillus peritrichatus TaxID=718191 RepID=A0ABP7MUK1_9GAMM
MQSTILGAIEHCDLPDLDIFNMQVRVDTGAKTSSIHVDNVECVEKDGAQWISFDIHPDVHNVNQIVRREALLKRKNVIKSSNGQKEQRFVIDTWLKLGAIDQLIELTLTDRSSMSYLMLLGRQAMPESVLVDPNKEFLQDSK